MAKEYITVSGGNSIRIKNFPEIAGKQIRMYFDFDTQENEAIEVQLAISPVSQANAMENLEKETGSLSFQQVKAKAQEDWNKELNKIVIKGTEDQKSQFLYSHVSHFYQSDYLYGC